MERKLLLILLLLGFSIVLSAKDYIVISIEGSNGVTINGSRVTRDKICKPSDVVFLSGRSKICIKRIPNGVPIEIIPSDLNNNLPTNIDVAISNSILRQANRTQQAAKSKGLDSYKASISIVNQNGICINDIIANNSGKIKGCFQIFNKSEYALYFNIVWFDDIHGFKNIINGIRIDAGKIYRSEDMIFESVHNGEFLFLYASLSNSFPEQFKIVDDVEF